MATKLEKDITRESAVLCDDKEIMVTLTKDQKVSMKLKGKRTGTVTISIEELYNQLSGEESSKTKSLVKPTKKNPMILLNDLRSHNAISGGDYKHISYFDGVIRNLIDSMK
tara:strand:- start:1200 stop:1532 length:333 start_codon:yes stop_codon:yes gene_type:complete